jgi:hypothetical protein
MNDVTERHLSGSPALPMFVRAGVSMAPGALRLPFVAGGGREIPELTLALDDVPVDRGRVTAYDRVCGYALGDSVPATYIHILAFPLQLSLMTGGNFPGGRDRACAHRQRDHPAPPHPDRRAGLAASVGRRGS